MSRRFFLAVGVLLLVVGFAAGQDAGDFFFIQLSDPQFGAAANNKDFEQESANYEFAVANINRLHPKFVVITGDLINKTGDPAQAAEYFRITRKIDRSIPVYVTPGNHDVGDEPTPDTLAYYREHFGKDYYSFREGSLYGIILNSSLISAPSKAQADAHEQEQWLQDELRQAKNSGARHVVIFQHHSWFLERPDEPAQYFNIPLEQRKRYLDLFKSSGVRYLISGHYHRNAHGSDGELEMITTSSVSRPLGNDPTGMRVLTVRADRLEHRYYGFGDIPNRYSPPPDRQQNQ